MGRKKWVKSWKHKSDEEVGWEGTKNTVGWEKVETKVRWTELDEKVGW